ncbi:transcriptional regulator family: GATA type zinc finger [Purpureocillium lilacinum]|uniref:Transcriptional regulator family: GATA type zinc finger n=1 Tax=Purpureocillium lilacinum TaxID=33203 RepID=A0ABR0CBZ6_PURLI|nr:transcriptional regulator family: GATA type zinc finger [Purpureocillium lilacinum]
MSITSLSPGHAPCTRSPRDKRANKDPDTLRQQQQQRELGRRHSRDVEPKARSGDDGSFEMIRRELDADCTIVISSSPLTTPVKQERSAAKAEAPQARQAHKTRRQRLSNAVMRCHACGTGDTPEWRHGPGGPGTLCNVCGLVFQKQQRRFLRDAGRRW